LHSGGQTRLTLQRRIQERKKAVKEFNKERRKNKTPKAEKKRKEKLAKRMKGKK
jgi:hypothetical protein